MRSSFLCLALLVGVTAARAGSGTISLTPHGPVVVWGQDQTITGILSHSGFSSGALYVNGVRTPFTILDTSFAVPVRVSEGTTSIVASVDSAGAAIWSDTLRMTLGYRVRPECQASVTVSSRDLFLHAAILENPDGAPPVFSWRALPSNPAPLALSGARDSLARATVPSGAPPGRYFFDVVVSSPGRDSIRARACVTINGDTIAPFDIMKDRAPWIDTAVVYCIVPHYYVVDGNFRDIIPRIAELAELGITAIWITPIFPTTEPNLGYHVLDYFKIRDDFGTEQDLRDLVAAAHARGVRILLDIVPNHTTIYHPYAQDAIAFGPRSHYYDFYDHGTKVFGLMPFATYFYPELVNLNFGNPEVQRMMMEAGRYWIEKFDIDGYRIDMVWAVDARYPGYMRKWSTAMKRTKPDVFLLAEAFADTTLGDYPLPRDRRYDAAYDWGRMGHNAWETPFIPGSGRPASALAGWIQRNQVSDVKTFRFLENNDGARFLEMHPMQELKMAATLLMTIHGVPSLFMAQEIGSLYHAYSGIPVFNRGMSVHSQDRYGLVPFYKGLIWMRKHFACFTSDRYEPLTASPESWVLAYHRWEGSRHAYCVLNIQGTGTSAVVNIPFPAGLDSTRQYFLTDLVTGEVLPVTPGTLQALSLNLNPYMARVFLLDTTAVATSVPAMAGPAIPEAIALSQNYPNPFNPSTSISFALPSAMRVRLRVYDLLGRIVTALYEGECGAGRHTVTFNGAGLASGIYFYRLETGASIHTLKMILEK